MPKRSYDAISKGYYDYSPLLNNIHKAIRHILFDGDVCIHNVTYDIRNSTIVISNFTDEQIAYRVYERLLSFPNIVSYMNRNIIISIPL
jgi:hypothetical protein